MRNYVENYMVRGLEEALAEHYKHREEPEHQCAYCGEYYDVEDSDADDHNKFCCEDCEEQEWIYQSRQKEINSIKSLVLMASSEHNQKLFNGE